MIFGWLTDRRREKLLETPFPDAWIDILEDNVTAYTLLEEAEQQKLRDLTQVFIDEKHWEGCGGVELDDEMRVTIAGSACLLILGRDHDLMDEVESILVYPSAVMLPDQARGFFDSRPVVNEGGKAVLGVAHSHGGPVVLAWDSVLQGAKNARDGHNLVIHEIAHKIDFLDGSADGTPPLETAEERRAWARVCTEAFNDHVSGEEDLLRDYATTNEAEFFAVASEVFFEKPKQMRGELPELYGLLKSFYNLDLAARDTRPTRKQK
ncbi:MAG: zinc-dependent peptidase [Proteobacteria bacterium]|nr:zinc-dependent peptidase [Pseudomonadota bacterium]